MVDWLTLVTEWVSALWAVGAAEVELLVMLQERSADSSFGVSAERTGSKNENERDERVSTVTVHERECERREYRKIRARALSADSLWFQLSQPERQG